MPATILVASLILGGFYFAIQVNKQRSIERQQELKLEQEHKEYIAKRRLECYEIYERERDKWYNVVGHFYQEKGYGLFGEDDICFIRYKNPNWKEGDPLEDKYFSKEF